MLKKIAAGIAGLAVAAVGVAAIAANISGAGATFPAPIYQKWAEAYKAATGNQLNYQAIGSGGGIKQIEAIDRRLRRLRQAAEAGRSRRQRPAAVPDRHRRRRAGGEPRRGSAPAR